MNMKCSWCGNTENLVYRSYTYVRKDGATRGSYKCRACNTKYKKEYRDKCKKMVYDHYGNKCACCSETEPAFLTIDHVNNDGNVHLHPSGSRVTGDHLYRHIRKNGYSTDFQILCMNCNFGKRMNGGVCPHKNDIITLGHQKQKEH